MHAIGDLASIVYKEVSNTGTCSTRSMWCKKCMTPRVIVGPLPKITSEFHEWYADAVGIANEFFF